jgi:hypothetical protein
MDPKKHIGKGIKKAANKTSNAIKSNPIAAGAAAIAIAGGAIAANAVSSGALASFLISQSTPGSLLWNYGLIISEETSAAIPKLQNIETAMENLGSEEPWETAFEAETEAAMAELDAGLDTIAAESIMAIETSAADSVAGIEGIGSELIGVAENMWIEFFMDFMEGLGYVGPAATASAPEDVVVAAEAFADASVASEFLVL